MFGNGCFAGVFSDFGTKMEKFAFLSSSFVFVLIPGGDRTGGQEVRQRTPIF